MELKDCEEKLQKQFDIVDDIAFFNQKKVLDAFVKNKVTSQCFAGTTGYGYDDVGRDTLAKVYADVFGGESAIVSPLITCGSHAITIVLFGLLRPNDILLSATGNLYDTLSDTLLGKNNGSLENFGVKYMQVDMAGNNIDEALLVKKVKKLKPKVVFFQRSRGYSERKALSVDDMEGVFKKIKEVSPKSFIVVDNCYGEFLAHLDAVGMLHCRYNRCSVFRVVSIRLANTDRNASHRHYNLYHADDKQRYSWHKLRELNHRQNDITLKRHHQHELPNGLAYYPDCRVFWFP